MPIFRDDFLFMSMIYFWDYCLISTKSISQLNDAIFTKSHQHFYDDRRCGFVIYCAWFYSQANCDAYTFGEYDSRGGNPAV